MAPPSSSSADGPPPPPITADQLRRIALLVAEQLVAHRQHCAICLPTVPCPEAKILEDGLAYWMARVQLTEAAGGKQEGR